MTQNPFKVDLSAQLAECEANYARIMQLLPDMDDVDRREFGVEMRASKPVRFSMEVTERCKYTTMVDVNQLYDDSANHSWQQPASFSLRIYHDARMAEVVAYNRHLNFLPSYQYPNDRMYQCDEKIQLNAFLGEWLSHCLRYGHVLNNPADTADAFSAS